MPNDRTTPTDIPAAPATRINRQVRLMRRPGGIPQRDDFALAEAPVPEPGEGQFRVRNLYLSVDPAQRGWASAEANYSAPVALDGPMRALAVGVVDASRCDEVAEGEYLYGWFGWQDFAVAEPSAIILRADLPVPLAQFGGLVGINGLTAYLALTKCGRPVEGDRMLVSTAAGGVGSLVGQIGRILGCRCFGLAGSDDKVALCTGEYGYETAWNYKTADLDAVLSDTVPEGLDVYFDNVGGTILDRALRHLAVGARVVQCGTASVPSWTPPPTGPRNEREILTRRLQWSGFVLFDHMAEFRRASRQLAEWYAAGRIDLRLEILDGIEHAAGSIADLYAGRNNGKRMIRIV